MQTEDVFCRVPVVENLEVEIKHFKLDLFWQNVCLSSLSPLVQTFPTCPFEYLFHIKTQKWQLYPQSRTKKHQLTEVSREKLANSREKGQNKWTKLEPD
jgi:hypothetical protein